MILITILLAVTTNCGEATTSKPPPGPWIGSAGNVLIGESNNSDHLPDQLWVGFNDNMWQQFEALRSKHGDSGNFWIGGHVVVNGQSSVGFYFDPKTAVVGEVTAEGAQTALDFIKADPATFTKSGIGDPPIWYVPAVIKHAIAR